MENNQNDQLNPRGIVFLEGRNAQNSINPVSGFAPQSATGPLGQSIPQGAFVDPWGDEYVVFIDASESGNINQALSWFYVDPLTVNAGVGACSLGKDRVWGSVITPPPNGPNGTPVGDGKFAGSNNIATWR